MAEPMLITLLELFWTEASGDDRQPRKRSKMSS